MGSSHRLAAIAAASHSRHYNHTTPEVTHSEPPTYGVNVLFVSVTLCGVLVAACAACWRRAPRPDKPEDVQCARVYTVSHDLRLINGAETRERQLRRDAEIPTGTAVQDDIHGPPPAYDSVVDESPSPKDSLQEVVTEPCPRCYSEPEGGLPSYEAAVLLRDTKL